MAFDYPNGTYTIGSIPLIAVLLVAGWFGVRKRVHAVHSTAPGAQPTQNNVIAVCPSPGKPPLAA